MQVVYGQIKQIKSENCFIKFDRCHKIKNSWKLTQMLMLKSKTWRTIIAIEEKCRQLNWCFRYMVIVNQDATSYFRIYGLFICWHVFLDILIYDFLGFRKDPLIIIIFQNGWFWIHFLSHGSPLPKSLSRLQLALHCVLTVSLQALRGSPAQVSFVLM